MGVNQDPNTPGNMQRIEADGAARVTVAEVGDGYSQSLVTGTIAAALAANAAVFGMRLNPGAGTKRVRIAKIVLTWTCIVAFTTPVTAGRRLAIYRGAGAAMSGGTAAGISTEKNTASPASQCDVAQGGDIRIASTGALTVTGITFDAVPFDSMNVVNGGTAGATIQQTFEFSPDDGNELVLSPGEVLAIRNGPNAMDAAGTWQLGVDIDWIEITDLA